MSSVDRVSEEADELAEPATDQVGPGASGASVLPFPSNRPLDRAGDVGAEPRLRNVIGDVLRDERLRQDRTLADVAADAAVSLPYLSEVERGRKEVSSDLLDAIGTALELPLVEILERSAARLRVDVRAIELSLCSAEVRGQCTTRFRLAA